MRRVTVRVRLRLRGPILSQSSSIGAPGFDALMAQGRFSRSPAQPPERRYYLPGSLLKGLLREAWQELGTVDPSYTTLLPQWLGKISPELGNEPMRGRMQWSDFVDWTTTPSTDPPSRTRIAIDDERGAADSGMLQVLESPYASGETAAFEGTIHWLGSDSESERPVLEALERGLLWLRAAGGVRTAGFGGVLGAELTASTQPLKAASSLAEKDRLELRLRFAEPVIFSKRRVADNWFESEDVISGGALKGAVATMIDAEPGLFGDLSAELSGLGFTHAFPAAVGKPRPSQWPLSMVSYSSDADKPDFGDAMTGGAKPVRQGKPWAFDIDWKDGIRKIVERSYGWPKLERQVRVRTAFDGSKGKADEGEVNEGGRLFAWRMVEPFDHEWVCCVDLSELSPEARKQLVALVESFGMGPLGKSKAWAEIVPRVPDQQTASEAKHYVVTLQTPALLLDPGRMLAPNGGIGAKDADTLRAALAAAWQEVSGGALRLVDYFQRCSLAGGGYLLQRFGTAREQYRPYLLSDAGSTFRLEPAPGRETDAAAIVGQWRKKGLPLTASVRGFYGIPDAADDQWKHCPYLPENGYGEIVANEPVKVGGNG